MDAGIVIAIISSVEGIGVAVIGWFIAKSNRRNDNYRKEREEREKEREEREHDALEATEASYNLLFALADGLDVLLRKAHGDNLNGDVEKAQKELNKAKGDLNHKCNEQLAKLRNN